jgi:ketosteroid isomerase-like protein
MTNSIHLRILSLAVIVFLSCNSAVNEYQLTRNYQPDDAELYRAIITQDSLFFDAYNHCDEKLEDYASFYMDDVEFYHDKGGLTTSKKELVESTRMYVCGKVTRELVKGSVEVYPIPGYGAIEIGLHKFHNASEPNHEPHISRFTIVWKQEDDVWKIAKVISLH